MERKAGERREEYYPFMSTFAAYEARYKKKQKDEMKKQIKLWSLDMDVCI